jgi:glutathione S-transferase
MALAFFHGHGSPFAWRVWLALEHKGIPYDVHVVSFDKRETHSPEFLRMNPRGKVPVIVDGDFTLTESAAILEYLDERYPDAPRLFPTEIRARALVRRSIRVSDHYIGIAVQTLGRELFERGGRDTAVIARAKDQITGELGNIIVEGDYVCGALSAADFTLYPLLAILHRFDRRQPDLDLHTLINPALTAWMKRIEALPYFRKTYPAHWS